MKNSDAIKILKMVEAHGILTKEAKELAIKALEEVQRYRAIGTPEELKSLKENGAFTGMELAQLVAMQMSLREYEKIGTVEECREAVEKQTAKKPLHKRNGHYCPICNNYFDSRDWKSKYCGLCGQKLDWSDEDGKID